MISPAMQRRQRDLRRAGEVQVVVGQAVDLLLGVGKQAGPVQGLLADQHRWDHRLKALGAQLFEREVDERELEHHEIALQVCESGPRRAGRGLHVDPRAGQLEVVAAGGPGLPTSRRTASSSGALAGTVRRRR